MIRSYKELIVWQRAIDLIVRGYVIASRLPDTERYGLSSQIRRSATSVAANIAEGHARRKRTEFIHFLSIAHGSLVELETHLTIVVRVGYATESETRDAMTLCSEVSRMLFSMRRKLGDVRAAVAGR